MIVIQQTFEYRLHRENQDLVFPSVRIGYRIFFYWFAIDIRWHLETITRCNYPSVCFKTSSGIYSKPVENYNGNSLVP